MPTDLDLLTDDYPKEECGVFGAYVPGEEASRLTFFGIFALQHRGQESAGIAVSNGSNIHVRKDLGLVSQVFNEEILSRLPGHISIGHTRYSTTGRNVVENAQPFTGETHDGTIAVSHNGNLINTVEIRHELESEGVRFFSTSDSEVIARLLEREMVHGPVEAVRRTMSKIKGAYSVTVLTKNLLIGFRDPNGVRPLVFGKLRDGWMLASETCAFSPIGGIPEREINAGEAVIIGPDGPEFVQIAENPQPNMCLFEFIYFARPDSRMYDISLYQVRERMGRALFAEHPVEADLIVPVPDSGIPAAIGYAEASGIPFGEGMMKSRYIHRTFIQPDQKIRELGVRMKLSALHDNIRGKRIVLVDDSIVRGTTTDQIVKLMREAGATEVHVRITAPPIKFPCFYGIDMADKGQLIAAKLKTVKKIEEHIGADSLGYLSVEAAAKAAGRDGQGFCLACFTGDYPIAGSELVSGAELEEKARNSELVTISDVQPNLFE
jgi:amidophosphoribosyltransferase